MRYPKAGEQVRVKNETGLYTVINVAKFGLHKLVTLNDGRKFFTTDLVTRHQKTIETYVIQVNYGQWEDVTQEETLSEARQSLKDYRENQNYPVRLIIRREPNELYQEKE